MIVGSVLGGKSCRPGGDRKIAGDSARVGWYFFLNIMALMSVSFGVLNLRLFDALTVGTSFLPHRNAKRKTSLSVCR